MTSTDKIDAGFHATMGSVADCEGDVLDAWRRACDWQHSQDAAEIARLRKIITDIGALSVAQCHGDSIACRDAMDALMDEAQRLEGRGRYDGS